jgi:hypothetical protein
MGGPQSRYGRHGEENILDLTGTRTPNIRPSSLWSVAIPTELSRLLLRATLMHNEVHCIQGDKWILLSAYFCYLKKRKVMKSSCCPCIYVSVHVCPSVCVPPLNFVSTLMRSPCSLSLSPSYRCYATGRLSVLPLIFRFLCVHILSKESRLLVLPRTSCIILYRTVRYIL